MRARIPNERRERAKMAEEDLARAQNPQNPLRERAKPAQIGRKSWDFPDFPKNPHAGGLKMGRFPRARPESWANSREISGTVFPDFPLTCAHILARARVLSKLFLGWL